MQAAADPWNSEREQSRGARGSRRSRGRPRARGLGPRGPRTAPSQPAVSAQSTGSSQPVATVQPAPAAQSEDVERQNYEPRRPRGGRFRRGRGRFSRPISSGEIVKTDPVFSETKDLEPEARGLNLRLTVVTAPKLIKHLRFANGREEKEWEVTAGDATGSINLRVIAAEVADHIGPNTPLVVRNGFVEMVNRKHMRLATDLFGKVEIASEQHSFQVDKSVNHSDAEYEKE